MTNTNNAPGPRHRVLPLFAAVAAAAAIVVFWPADRRDDATGPEVPVRDSEHRAVPAAGGNAAAPEVEGPDRLPAIRDLELALEAALAEQRAAESALRNAETALLDVEEQLDLRVEQGEAPDDLEAEATAMLDGVFASVQDALRRLDQADASVEMLEEELAAARRGRDARD